MASKLKLPTVEATLEENNYIIKCPGCQGIVICDKKDINCKQFIHAVDKITHKQLNNHKKMPDDMKDRILGCGQRFKIK